MRRLCLTITCVLLALGGFAAQQPAEGGNPKDRFKVPKGFRVEEAVAIPETDKLFSLVNLTFDAKGRLLVSREGGSILLCTDPDKNGVLQTVRPYCKQVTNCQGMCWVDDALLLVGNGPKGTGLYRVRDTKGKDETDEVTLLHRFNGGLGEHGPHAIVHGPDDWLYVAVGNHTWADVGPDAAKNGVNPAKLANNSPLTRWPTGHMGPDQGKTNTTEEVLLPRLNDAGAGHAANILAPGGTIWRLDKNGKNVGLVSAGFRNHFDIAFSPLAELFTFDSDMELDVGLPWYRAVRAYHCPPGSDFLWRTGAANTPDYYLDNLPPLHETGRGSPVGVEFYDHRQFPKKYQGAFFMSDWSIGLIYAVHLERSGASYKATAEKFCQGSPMNVTDCIVGPDGALYFSMGGRGTQGGVYRIVYTDGKIEKHENVIDQLLDQPQPLSPWSRAWFREVRNKDDSRGWGAAGWELRRLAFDGKRTVTQRIRALDLLHQYWTEEKFGLDATLQTLAGAEDAELRAHAIWLLGVHPKGAAKALDALTDPDARVRRRACETLVRAEVKAPVAKIWPLLSDSDRFVRTAARIVLAHINPDEWAAGIAKETNDQRAWNAMVVLCQSLHGEPYAEAVFNRLAQAKALQTKNADGLVDVLRTLELAMIHLEKRPETVNGLANKCLDLFPQSDWRVNRELAILLTQFQREGLLSHVQDKLLDQLFAEKTPRTEQIHFFYCIRLLRGGWSAEQKSKLWTWYEATKTWSGGYSFGPFLQVIFRETLQAYTPAERKQFLAAGEKTPLPTLALAQRLDGEPQLELLPDLNALADRLVKAKIEHHGTELIQAVQDALTRTAVAKPGADAWPYLVRGLATKNPLLRNDVLSALRKLDKIKPKTDNAEPFRAVILATDAATGAKERWQGIELLRQWTGRGFGAEPEEGKKELSAWTRWFGQTFPKEPALANLTSEKSTESKYKLPELIAFLDKESAKASPARGRMVFEKAQCIKCHKFGKAGEGIGPDLTAISKRFKRSDLLDAILFPSKVISDQYRAVTIILKNGQILTGLAAVQGEQVTVLRSDASKITLKTADIESQVASLVSVMPERLLDGLTLSEIADLVAFLEGPP